MMRRVRLRPARRQSWEPGATSRKTTLKPAPEIIRSRRLAPPATGRYATSSHEGATPGAEGAALCWARTGEGDCRARNRAVRVGTPARVD